jgi:hypothetical protein
LTVGACATLLWTGVALAFTTPQQRCEAGKNDAAGKYAACRQTAEKNFVLYGDAAKYGNAIDRCDATLATKWQKLEAAAVARGVTCPSTGDAAAIETFLTANADSVSTALHTPPLITDVATCNADVSTCNAGTAAVGDVLSGKTFSSSAGLGVNGTMRNNGAANFTPGAAAVPVPAGYYSGGQVNTDTSLLSGNIKSGATIFGVSGDPNVVNTSGATAAATNILSGQTCYANGSVVTGTVPAGANVIGANGLKTFTIPDGLYAGSKTATANDTNLVSGNIASGVSILGVMGTAGVMPSQVLKTGETNDYGPGSDGNLQKGAARLYTDNGDGTISDDTTGLMWEKKDRSGGIHDYGNTYTWGLHSSPYTMNGTMVTTLLAALNGGGGFAGHTDWRIPNLNELQSIANYHNTQPAVVSVFNTSCVSDCTVDGAGGTTMCSCISCWPTTTGTWTSTTFDTDRSSAWTVDFTDGRIVPIQKGTGEAPVRAVRGGL